MITLRSRHAAVALALSVALALAGCVALVPKPTPTPVPPTPTTGPASGVEGIVLVGPTCPVERLGDPCPDKPVAVNLALYDARYAGPTLRPAGRHVQEWRRRPFHGPRCAGRLHPCPRSVLDGQRQRVLRLSFDHTRERDRELGAYTPVVVHGDTGIR